MFSMLWLLMALLVIVGGILMLRRKADFQRTDDEPWRASLDDEPFDIDEVRRAEEEWLQESEWEDVPEDESWR